MDRGQCARWIATRGEKTPRQATKHGRFPPIHGNLYNDGFARAYIMEPIKLDGMGFAFPVFQGIFKADTAFAEHEPSQCTLSTVSASSS